MRIHVPQDWEISESSVTPEAAYIARDRRSFLKTAALGLAGTLFLSRKATAATAGLPPVDNPDFLAGALKVTPYNLVTSYNNFYEFGTDKSDPKNYANDGWKPEPGWNVEIAGMVGNPGKWDVEDLVKKMGGIEQRVYRHRCVEAWSMVIPWDGFPLARLVAFAQPMKTARFLKFLSFVDPQHATGQKDGNLDYPYVEGLVFLEAINPLAFIATGIYGKPLPNQNGAPLRLVTPWKYGFKGIKSIVKIEFTDQMPVNTWRKMAANEYGFFANVNPTVDHPRWSQASEQVIGGGGFFGTRQPTLMFNGYEKQVASLYQGMDLRKFY
jgi:sulfoxide reductase catalytic subunit YedY